ncbi:IS4 family transposase, partial [Tepidiphilus baoligensis]
RHILPKQAATSKRGPKIGKPTGYVEGSIAHAHVSTARVLQQAQAARP